MVVTELAVLRLTPGTSVEAITPNLSKAKQVMEAWGNKKFHYLQCAENQSLIYIIGCWDSVEQHMNEFVSGKENQQLLDLLKDQMTIESLTHLDLDPSSIPVNAPVLSLGIHYVDAAKKDAFVQAFEKSKSNLWNHSDTGIPVGGWRIDKQDETKDEFVLFSPWEDVKQHVEFATSEGSTEYNKIREHITGALGGHMKLLQI